MSSDVWCCGEGDSVSECARLMAGKAVGFVPVQDERGALCGVITDRDLVTRVLAAGLHSDARVGAVMTRPVVSCAPDDELRDAELRMAAARVSRVAVVAEGRCVGILSLADVLRVEEPMRASRLARALAGRDAKPPPSLR